MPAASEPCIDFVPGAGDMRSRQQYPVTCPTASPKSAAKAAHKQPDPDGPSSNEGVNDPEDSTGPKADDSAPVTPTPTPPAASLTVGAKSSAGPGSYVLWIKAENRVYLVAHGLVKRVMLTTAEPWKTLLGTTRFNTRRGTRLLLRMASAGIYLISCLFINAPARRELSVSTRFPGTKRPRNLPSLSTPWDCPDIQVTAVLGWPPKILRPSTDLLMRAQR